LRPKLQPGRDCAQGGIVNEIFAAFLIFVCLMAASLGCLALHKRLPLHHRDEETHSVIKLTAGVFVVTTSLMLGLLINSAKNKFEANDTTLHAYATELILLDRSLRRYGPEAAETRQRLQAVVKRVLASVWPADGKPMVNDDVTERLLDETEDSLNALKPGDTARGEIWRHAKQHLLKAIELRWDLVENAHSELPTPLIIMMVGWLVLIFASFGFRAPPNPVVVAMFVVSGFLISSSLYLTMDMDSPFSGPMQVSPAPMQRALEFMQR
jgi:hypothetical protein